MDALSRKFLKEKRNQRSLNFLTKVCEKMCGDCSFNSICIFFDLGLFRGKRFTSYSDSQIVSFNTIISCKSSGRVFFGYRSKTTIGSTVHIVELFVCLFLASPCGILVQSCSCGAFVDLG